jgi:hypothetical protein
VSNRIHNFSHLESIEVYTVRDNVNLVDILKAMEGSSEKLPGEKDNAGLKTYFTKVYPELDFERVYSSDLKKMVKWFSVLKNNQIEIKLTEPAPEEEAAETTEQPAAPAKKAKAEPIKAKAEPIKEEPKAKKTTPEKAAPAKEKETSPAPAKSKTKAGSVKEEPKAKKAASEKAAPKKKTEEKEKTAAKPAKKAAPKKKK